MQANLEMTINSGIVSLQFIGKSNPISFNWWEFKC